MAGIPFRWTRALFGATTRSLLVIAQRGEGEMQRGRGHPVFARCTGSSMCASTYIHTFMKQDNAWVVQWRCNLRRLAKWDLSDRNSPWPTSRDSVNTIEDGSVVSLVYLMIFELLKKSKKKFMGLFESLTKWWKFPQDEKIFFDKNFMQNMKCRFHWRKRFSGAFLSNNLAPNLFECARMRWQRFLAIGVSPFGEQAVWSGD